MASVGESKDVLSLLDEMTARIKGCRTLEGASQVATSVLYEGFSESIVLARLFATVPFEKLPAANRSFVVGLADRQGISDLIKDDTLVLSLLGTRGTNPAWNDRRRSEGHVGIPLASPDFIDGIPMLSALLKGVGLDLAWMDRKEAIEIKAASALSGTFYVPDAETAVDDRGRKIIPAQDFVLQNKVKTVFGFGGGYPTTRTYVTLIVFCRERLEKSQIEPFLLLLSHFKAMTVSLVSTEAVFA